MKDWHHAPVHRLSDAGAYMVTAATLHKLGLFHDSERLNLLCACLFEISEEFQWKLQAWAVMRNHYHFLAITENDAGNLRKMITKFHAVSANALNKIDGMRGRRVWFQYWDSHIF